MITVTGHEVILIVIVIILMSITISVGLSIFINDLIRKDIQPEKKDEKTDSKEILTKAFKAGVLSAKRNYEVGYGFYDERINDDKERFLKNN